MKQFFGQVNYDNISFNGYYVYNKVGQSPTYDALLNNSFFVLQLFDP